MNQSCFYNTINIKLPVYRITLSSIYSCTAITTVVANAVVFYMIWITSSLHRPSFVLVANLALTDFLVGAIGEPALIFTHVAALNNWTDFFCYAWIGSRTVTYWCGSMSLLTLTTMGIDRLLAVILIDKYQEVVTVRRVIRVLMAFWLFLGLLMTLAFFPITKVVVFIAMYISLLLVALVISYILAFRKLRKLSLKVNPYNDSQKKKRGETLFKIFKCRRSLNTMLIFTVTIVLFSVPFLCCAITTSVIYKIQPNYAQTDLLNVTYKLMTSGELIAFANSAVNPFVYTWRMRELRRAIKSLTRKLFNKVYTN